jgi:hypothetical protein
MSAHAAQLLILNRKLARNKLFHYPCRLLLAVSDFLSRGPKDGLMSGKKKSIWKTEDGQMNRQSAVNNGLAVFVVMGILLLSVSPLAKAQSDALGQIYVSAANVSTNIPGIHTYAEPPNGFNPVTATDVELATYGFPPRPDQQADPDHYALWERAMTAAKIRWNGELKPQPGKRAMIPAGSSVLPETVHPEVTGPQRISTANASGVILTNKQKTFNKNSFYEIFTVISVPVVQEPFGSSSCSPGYWEEESIAGIDGYIYTVDGVNLFEPGLEGGVSADVYCSEPNIYSAFFGWQSFSGMAGTTHVFNVNPGDLFYTNQYVTGPNNASVFLEDMTTLTYNSYSVSTPGIIGKTANWIVDRACCNPYPDPYALANSIGISFENGGAVINVDDGKNFYPGSQASSTQILTMTDDEGDQNIEIVNQGINGYQGLNSLWFEVTGCAYSGGCTP